MSFSKPSDDRAREPGGNDGSRARCGQEAGSLRPQVRAADRTVLLLAALVLLFVMESAAFNSWLHIGSRIYYQMYAAAFALGALLYGPAAFLRPRWRYAYLAAVSTLVSVIFIAEYLYYSYGGGFLQISALKLVRETGAVMGTAVRLCTPKLALFLSNVFLVLFAGFYARRHKIIAATLTFGEKMMVTVLILASVFGGYHTLLTAEKREGGDGTRLYSLLFDLDTTVGKMGVANYFLYDAAKRVLKSGRVTNEDKAFVKQWSATRPGPAAPGDTFGAAAGRNLILIQVESLETAVIGAKFGGLEITPELNTMAREGLYFSNYYAPIDLGSTADAEFMTLNSLYPLSDSVAFIDHAQNQYEALPQLLADHGYRTCILHSDVPTFWNRANIYPRLGYQTWYAKDDYNITRRVGYGGLGDADFFEQSLSKIETLKQPFMATLMTMTSHTPFKLPEDLRGLPIPARNTLNSWQTQYLESIHYTDRAIGHFVEALKQTGLYDRSVIAIFGDHGSLTGISQALGTGSVSVAALGYAQVPLIILAPGTGLKGEQSIPASHLDIYPTAAHLLGFGVPRCILGQDLLNTAAPVAVHRKRGTGEVSVIVGARVLYAASTDGDFTHGKCYTADKQRRLPIDQCRELFDQQSAILKVSDTVVRGDMIDELR